MQIYVKTAYLYWYSIGELRVSLRDPPSCAASHRRLGPVAAQLSTGQFHDAPALSGSIPLCMFYEDNKRGSVGPSLLSWWSIGGSNINDGSTRFQKRAFFNSCSV